MTEKLTAFPPVARKDAEILILGSMPSVKSLEEGFYYGHPRNAFWRILADIYDCQLPGSIADKVALLTEHRVALWDTVHACRREGSLDSAIRDAEPNDFGTLFSRCPDIQRVLFNGNTACKLFMKAKAGGLWLQNREWAVLPSTSPAYTIPYELKLQKWREAIACAR